MNEQDAKDIIEKINDAIKVALGEKWDEAQDFAKSETNKFAKSIADIACWKEAGKISEEQGKVLIRMHQRSMQMVLTALEGISLVLAEKAINAAIDAIGDIVNGIIGWKLF